MSDSLLDPAELEAIQNAIRETAPRRASGFDPDVEPTRLALIADDRSAEAARPLLMTVMNRWVRRASKALRNYLPGTWQLDVVGAETIDGQQAKEELRGAWIAGGTCGTAELVFAVQGPVIDIAAAKRCGASAPESETTRTPSAISLRLFQPVGRTLFESLGPSWQEIYDHELVASGDLTIVQRLIEARTTVRVTLAFAGAVAGRVQIYARPEALVPKQAALAAIQAKAQSVASALSHVPVEIVAELGTLRMSLGKIRSLERGSTHVLPNFVDSRVPVYVAGVLKAWAKPVVCRGVLAVQIISVVHGQGTQS
ncbi:MAG: FliM/FliN family flagellar motor C-terminal domain-containing protein [Kofleriaceae bacterium]